MHEPGLLPEMDRKPFGGTPRRLFQCPWFFKKVRGAGYYYQLFFRLHCVIGLPVQFNDAVVVPSDDQERRGGDLSEDMQGEIGPSSP